MNEVDLILAVRSSGYVTWGQAHEIVELILPLLAAPSAPVDQAAPVTVPNVDTVIGQSKAVLRLVDEYIDGVQTQHTRTKLRSGLMDLFAAAPAAPSADAQDAKRITVSEGGVDWLGLALDLEQQAKRTESKTAMRVMNAAAHGLCLMGSASVSKDAARYRWLRARQWNDSDLCVVTNPKEAVKLGHDCPSLERLDETIDAALAQQKEGE